MADPMDFTGLAFIIEPDQQTGNNKVSVYDDPGNLVTWQWLPEFHDGFQILHPTHGDSLDRSRSSRL